ncbi:hypothetical protein V1477_003270 [Vespula maculifrons]|uniref:Uncharacterized protein n=1 Tax=Vespula maculifrons TaxID=7453 RepID=A0ABD2CU66_VESMC
MGLFLMSVTVGNYKELNLYKKYTDLICLIAHWFAPIVIYVEHYKIFKDKSLLNIVFKHKSFFSKEMFMK